MSRPHVTVPAVDGSVTETVAKEHKSETRVHRMSRLQMVGPGAMSSSRDGLMTLSDDESKEPSEFENPLQARSLAAENLEQTLGVQPHGGHRTRPSLNSVFKGVGSLLKYTKQAQAPVAGHVYGRLMRQLLTIIQYTDHMHGRILDVAYAPDGKTICLGSQDATASIVDAVTGKLLVHIKVHTAAVLAVAFSPDGKTVCLGSEDETASIFKVATLRERARALGESTLIIDDQSIPLTIEVKSGVLSVAFAPDGKTICLGLSCAIALLVDVATGKVKHEIGNEFFRHTAGQINGVAFAPDGKTV